MKASRCFSRRACANAIAHQFAVPTRPAAGGSGLPGVSGVSEDSLSVADEEGEGSYKYGSRPNRPNVIVTTAAATTLVMLVGHPTPEAALPAPRYLQASGTSIERDCNALKPPSGETHNYDMLGPPRHGDVKTSAGSPEMHRALRWPILKHSPKSRHLEPKI